MGSVELAILVSVLSDGLGVLLPDEQVPFGRYVRRLFGGATANSWGLALRRGELTVWIDDRAVTDLDSSVLVRPGAWFAVSPGRADVARTVTVADALNCRWN